MVCDFDCLFVCMLIDFYFVGFVCGKSALKKQLKNKQREEEKRRKEEEKAAKQVYFFFGHFLLVNFVFISRAIVSEVHFC